MTPEHIRKVLFEIHAKVPPHLKKNVVKEVLATPTIKMVMEHALTMESISEEKKKHIKNLLDAGEFSKKRVVEDMKIAKMIDQFVSREINRAIKSGILPSKAKMRKILDNEKRNNQSPEGQDSGK